MCLLGGQRIPDRITKNHKKGSPGKRENTNLSIGEREQASSYITNRHILGTDHLIFCAGVLGWGGVRRVQGFMSARFFH